MIMIEGRSRYKSVKAVCLVLFGMMVLCPDTPAQRPSVVPSVAGNQPSAKKQAQTPAVLKIRIEGERVTAEIFDCPLQTALQDLAERTGIIFEVRSQENSPVSVRLNQIPMAEAIQRIAAGSNTVFLYKPGAPGSEPISMVRIFPRGNEPIQPGIIYLGSGVVTKKNDALETPEQAVKALAESSKVQDREKAIEILVADKSEASVKALEDATSDRAPDIRVAAIEGLVALEARSALPRILRCLRDRHPGVRQSAVTAVALLGSADNVKQLKPLSADRDASVAAAAELAIRRLSANARK